MDNINQQVAAPVATPEVVTPVDTTSSETPVESKWYDGLPDVLKTNPSVTKFDSLEKLVESDVHKNKLIGKRVQDLTPDELKLFVSPSDIVEALQTKGFPSKVEDYKLTLGENLTLNPEFEKGIVTKAFEAGLPPDKVSELVKVGLQFQAEQQAKVQETWRTEVFNRYGKDAVEVINKANTALTQFAGKDFIEFLKTTGLGDHPVLVDTFYKIAQGMQEDKFPHVPGGEIVPDQNQVKKEVANLFADSNFYNLWKSGDRKAAEKVNALYRLSE